MSPFYALDIETSTNPGDGLDPTNPLTRIISAAIFIGPVEAESTPRSHAYFDDPDEAKLLEGVDHFFGESLPGVILTWNGSNFDIPFFITRSALLGVDLGLRAEISPSRKPRFRPCKGHKGGYSAAWYAHDHADIWPLFGTITLPDGSRTSALKPLARHYGLHPVEVDRTKMELLTRDELKRYNISDVEITYEMSKFVDFNAALDSKI